LIGKRRKGLPKTNTPAYLSKSISAAGKKFYDIGTWKDHHPEGK
jgi:hypothetical protein